MAAQGAHLDSQGTVRAAAPRDLWTWENGAPALRKRQRAFSRKLNERALGRLLTEGNLADQSRVRSCGGTGAGAWTEALPTDEALRFSDTDYQVAARFRLGQHLSLGGVRCANRYLSEGPGRQAGDRCPKLLDARGVHAATCLVGGHRKATHNGTRDTVAALLPGPGTRCTQNSTYRLGPGGGPSATAAR